MKVNEPSISPAPARPVRRSVRVVVPWDANQFNPNRIGRLHFGVKTKLKNAAKERARLGMLEAGRPRLTPPVLVQITLRRSRRLDEDNLRAALQPVINTVLKDDLRSGWEGVVPDDHPKYVHFLPDRQECGKQWQGKEEVEFLIQEVTAADLAQLDELLEVLFAPHL